MTSEESLDLVFFHANACCFIPVNFSAMGGAIGESNPRDTFPLAPTSSAIEFSKPGDLVDSRPNRKCFNLRDRAEQLKIHEAMVPKLCGIRQWEILNGEESAGPPRAEKCMIARPDPASSSRAPFQFRTTMPGEAERRWWLLRGRQERRVTVRRYLLYWRKVPHGLSFGCSRLRGRSTSSMPVIAGDPR